MVVICYICKNEFKTAKRWNKHAKEFGLIFKLYSGKKMFMVSLNYFLNDIFEVK